MRHYDFVIVGGGSAGCALANRISAEKRRTLVLTYEKGVIDIDFLNQRVRIATDAGTTGEQEPWPVAGHFTELHVQRAEPLNQARLRRGA